jgi:hypothetical protein
LNGPINLPDDPLSASRRDSSCLLFYPRLQSRIFISGGFVMPDSTIPADLLELKASSEESQFFAQEAPQEQPLAKPSWIIFSR